MRGRVSARPQPRPVADPNAPQPMQEQAHGHVIRTRLLTESSLIVHWLTAEHGRIATVARGARRPKSPLRGKLDLFLEADLSFQRSRASDLHSLREVRLRSLHGTLREDLNRVRQASYAVQLIERVTETDSPLPEIFSLFNGFIVWLGKSRPAPEGVLAFEAKLLESQGLRPDAQCSGLTNEARERLGRMIDSPWHDALPAFTPMSSPCRDELDRLLQSAIIHHWGRLPRSRPTALQSSG